CKQCAVRTFETIALKSNSWFVRRIMGYNDLEYWARSEALALYWNDGKMGFFESNQLQIKMNIL
ncbi:MAG: hypothetical protein OET63_06260, partial [Desulfobacterales bacterium]|nr:hypothetical protein [Desulfobacterales bacterium]